MHSITFRWLEQSCEAMVNLFLQQVFYSTVLFVVIWGLAYCLRRKMVHWQFGLWLLILVRLFLPPDINTPISARTLISHLQVISQSERSTEKTQNILDHLRSPNSKSALQSVDDILIYEQAKPKTGDRLGAKSDQRKSWPVVLMFVWFAGFWFASFVFLKKIVGFHRVIQRASLLQDEIITGMVERWRREFEIKRTVRIFSSDEYLSPFTLGILRPKIFVPQTLVQSKETITINSIIAHEMAHVKRLDDLWIKLQNVVQIVYFFHPVVWYANRQINLARESICDGAVLSRRTISPQDYGQGILNVLKLNVVGFEMNNPLPGFSNHRKTIEHRIRHIIKGDSMKPPRVLLVMVTTALIGMFLLPMAANKRIAAEGQTSANIKKDASAHSLEGWFALKFDPSVHNETKLPGELQSNKINPNLKPPQKQLQSFQSSIDNHFRPGVEYFTGDAPVRAVAGGIVHFVGQMPVGGGKVEGLYIRVAHDFYDGLRKQHYPRVTLYRSQAYRSSYYYLSRVVVEHWQTVKRGQIIGYGSKYSADNGKKVVIVLEERGNWVNPDHYGPGHGFMKHWDGKPNLEIDLEEMNSRLDRQIEVVKKLYSYYARRDQDNLYNKLHDVIDTEKYKKYPVRWSTIDRFKYLSHLYKKDRELFPNLSSEEFEALTKEFYSNQPIVLTLPFK